MPASRPRDSSRLTRRSSSSRRTGGNSPDPPRSMRPPVPFASRDFDTRLARLRETDGDGLLPGLDRVLAKSKGAKGRSIALPPQSQNEPTVTLVRVRQSCVEEPAQIIVSRWVRRVGEAVVDLAWSNIQNVIHAYRKRRLAVDRRKSIGQVNIVRRIGLHLAGIGGIHVAEARASVVSGGSAALVEGAKETHLNATSETLERVGNASVEFERREDSAG